MVVFKRKFCLKLISSQFKLLGAGRRFKSFNSIEWLQRRDSDPYFERARKENYRCRSAFKLIEIDEKYKLLKPGHTVLDVGAAPGSWSQVLANRTNSNRRDASKPVGSVIAIDTSFIYSIDGVKILSKLDFTDSKAQEQIIQILGGKKLNFVFSDMAPVATGIKSLDQENITKLVSSVIVFSVKYLDVGGGCLVKLWDGMQQTLTNEMKRFFNFVTYVKPKATYSTSSEIYLLGREFYGLKSSS